MKTFRRYKERANDKHVPFIQPKLNIGKPGDKYEVEADVMADKVVNNKSSQDTIQKAENTEEELQQKPLAASISPLVQKQNEVSDEESVQAKCTDCEQEEKVQRKEEEEENLQMKTEGSKSTSTNIESSLKSSKGSGRKLSKSVKQHMETGFGVDFSQVNIHTDNHAIQMNKQLHAQAFTHGNDIYFNKSKYNPSSNAGKHLLAHELTHTIQQKGNVIRKKDNGDCDRASISAAREQAFFRVQIVKHHLSGLHPTLGPQQQRAAMRLARKLVSPSIRSVRAVQRLIDNMLTVLSSNSTIVCGPEIEGCRSWNGYVENLRAPIHLCDSFFTQLTDEGRIRTLIHEAAHAAGIGDPDSESYLVFFDCETGMDDVTSADAWAHFVHCESSQTPDAVED